ncbi:hypothetical protein A0H81_13531 [Grifola frondosa]|uniref:Uncharacterized protein n=1 Tax=Grifola frondosa TaxID=5627 RepID=A0A1C7LQM0_GRIFR|nr:hypothetical protein A0H81_13531 [Grifola frondosa]
MISTGNIWGTFTGRDGKSNDGEVEMKTGAIPAKLAPSLPRSLSPPLYSSRNISGSGSIFPSFYPIHLSASSSLRSQATTTYRFEAVLIRRARHPHRPVERVRVFLFRVHICVSSIFAKT